MRRAKLLAVTICCVATIALPACGPISSVTLGRHGTRHVHHDHDGHGPPSHAPAHGHRRKHQHHAGNVELAFDTDLGVYVVLNLPNHYYWEGTYLRIESGHWYASADPYAKWRPHRAGSVPPALRKKYGKSKHRKKRKGMRHWKRDDHPGQGHGPASPW
jgi:hypothetical protein